ncbi:anti-sigma factor family protein [Gemmobacter serpentinus]|uniref:anti-sigma factor family protein n=1 Tax=Gemmobacter serpentinus TaxID=2652247 RepID=UPI00124F611A|nr:hypothetical protein [Gemmobacter serpentinus]
MTIDDNDPRTSEPGAMSAPTDADRPHGDHDIEGFVAALTDGQMPPEQRFEVADYLAQHPDLAAQTMADLRLTEGLRLALGAINGPAPAAMRSEARRVSAGLERQDLRRRYLPIAAAIACFALGWSGQSLMTALSPHSPGSTVTPLIDAALDAEAAMALRLAMQSQPESPRLDTAEIARALGITLPGLPQDWLVRDVQVVATQSRPGVAIAIETPDMGEIMLFSVAQSGTAQDQPPRAYHRDGKAFAVFSRDAANYVLVDNSQPLADLSQGANRLLRRF